MYETYFKLVDCQSSLTVLFLTKFCKNEVSLKLASSHGLVVKAKDSQPSGCGFKPCRCCNLDGMQAKLYYIEKGNAAIRMGHPKYFF